MSEVYNKISKILGPSPFPSSGQHMTGPLGLLSPHPGVSYLFTGTEALPTYDADGSSLWGIVNGGSSVYAGQLGSPPPSWTSSLGDAVKQIDNRLKVNPASMLSPPHNSLNERQKLIAILLKEMDDFARTGIREELASLDPLLRNVEALALDDGGGGREVFDLDQ